MSIDDREPKEHKDNGNEMKATENIWTLKVRREDGNQRDNHRQVKVRL